MEARFLTAITAMLSYADGMGNENSFDPASGHPTVDITPGVADVAGTGAGAGVV